ncbi:MAG: hypothetical protein QHJ73_12540 [Armatimonadota bacterium]|nr:hypothetical protein [Armatimonadota bacterium]
MIQPHPATKAAVRVGLGASRSPGSNHMELEITDRETLLLIRLLEAEIRDLRSAIHHAETHQIKTSLKEEEELARRLLERLRGAKETMAVA